MGQSSNKSSIETGIALALSFLTTSAFLYFFSQYLEVETLARVLSILLAFIGVIGLGIELNKLVGQERKLGVDNVGIGLAIGGI